MRDRLLYLTIGVLFGIVVTQWAIPIGKATVTTPAVGNIVALIGEDVVLTTNGELWMYHSPSNEWQNQGTIPIALDEVQFIDQVSPPVFGLVDKSGDLWEGYPGAWVNRGHPPVPPTPTRESTWGNVKSKFH